MSFYEMDPTAVQAVGRAVCRLTGGAAGLAQRYLCTLDEVAGGVHHPSVRSALDRYRERWHQPVYDVALEIDSLGNNTSASAVTIADTDLESGTVLAAWTGEVESQASHLTRQVNGSTAA